MRTLHIINSLSIGGAEKLVSDIVPLFQSKGLKVDVLLLNGLETSFSAELKRATVDKVFSLGIGSVYNPIFIFKIIPYLKNYDIVHVHLFPALYFTVLAKWLSFSNTKLIYTEHSTSNKRRSNFVFRNFDKIIYKGFSKIITIGEEVDTNLKLHLPNINSNKFILINNGVDITRILGAKALNKKDFFHGDNFTLIQVSSFRQPKDQRTLIKAMELLPSDIKLLLVGEGPLKDNCQKLADDLGLNTRIKFLGNRNDVPQLLKMADVAVLSSFHEGLSLSSIEGMVTNPFVASDVQGLSGIVSGYGLLFEAGNYKELASRILKLKMDEALYIDIKNRCSLRAKQFDISNMVNGYLNVYKEINND